MSKVPFSGPLAASAASLYCLEQHQTSSNMLIEQFFQLSFPSQMKVFNKKARFLISREQQRCIIGLYELDKSLIEMWVDRHENEVVGFRAIRRTQQLHRYVEPIPLELLMR